MTSARAWIFVVWLPLDQFDPEAFARPAVEAVVDRGRTPILLRAIAPAAAHLEDIHSLWVFWSDALGGSHVAGAELAPEAHRSKRPAVMPETVRLFVWLCGRGRCRR